MANCKKYNRAACGHMFKHYERAKDGNGEYLKFGNQEIDTSKSHLNYNLAAPDQSERQGDFVKKRCSEVKMQKRADVNVMCSWVVTAPKEIRTEETEKFFKETYNFLSERYGKDNVVSAHVHMDETTPHIHFAFVPVVMCKKKNILKVSAKEAINKQELQIFHKDLSRHMEKIFGRDVGILNEATKDGNREIDQLKHETLQKELAEITEEIQKSNEERDKLKKDIEVLENQETSLKEKIKGLEKNIKQEQKNFTDMQIKFKPRKDDLQRVNKLARQVKPPVLSSNVSLSKKDWDFIIDIAKQHAMISDATLGALESHNEVTEKLERCQRLYLAIASEVAGITHFGDREKLKQAVQEVLKDIEDWRVVGILMEDLANSKPSTLSELLEARESKISKKYSYAKKNKEYNQPSVGAKEKAKRKETHEI